MGMEADQDGQTPRVRDVGALIDERRISALQIRVLILCSLAILLDGFDIQTMALAVPSLAAQWGGAPARFGPVLAAALVGMSLGAAFLAPLGDRWGRRPMLVAGLALVGAASIATGLADNLEALLIGRFFTGVGMAVGLTNATALVSEYAPTRRRASLVTLAFCNIALGALIAGFSAPALIDQWGWRSIFFAGGVLPLLLAVLMLVALPESLRLLLVRRPGHPAIARLIGALLPGVAPEAVGAHQSGGTERAAVKTLLSPVYRRRTLILWCLFGLNLLVLYLLISWLPTLLREAHWSQGAALRGSVLIQLGGIVGGLLTSTLVDRGRAASALVIAFTLAIAALAGFSLLPPEITTWSLLLLMVGSGVSGGQLILYALAAGFYPPAIRATGLGWSAAVGRLGSIAGPLVGGLFLQQQLGAATTLSLLVVPLLVCIIAAMRLPRGDADDPVSLLPKQAVEEAA